MNELIAALIMACGQLSHTDALVAKQKSECVQRVAKCSQVIIHNQGQSYPAIEEVLKQCSSEVHL